MNRIEAKFAELRIGGAKALIPFITAGFPSLAGSYDFACMALENGADLLELGIPFSDPMADGPAVQFSSQAALDNGVRLKDIFAQVARLKSDYDQPLILMGYYNPLIARGVESSLRMASEAGADGLIIPDLPIEEGAEFRRQCDKFDMASVFLVAPTSDEGRIKRIERFSTGFIYAVSIAGTTGARGEFNPETYRYFGSLKKLLKKPFVIGFGISSPAMAESACRCADGVVIGSAFVDIYRKSKSPRQALQKAKAFLRNIRKAVRP